MNQPVAIVSQMDKDHLAIIRKNVENFILKCSEDFDASERRLLDVAPQIYEGAKSCFIKAKIETLDINPQSGADYILDICQDNSAQIPAGSFDYILCTEVLEHLLDPFAAVRELRRLLKPGGKIMITTPFNFRIHGPLPDCWRFTEHGLRALFSQGFKLLSLDAVETPGRELMPIHYTLIAEKSQASNV